MLIKPVNYIVKDTDQFYSLENKRYSFVTSEEHKHLLTSKQSKNKLYKNLTTKELYEKFNNANTGISSYKLTNIFEYDGKGVKLSDDEIRLQIAIFADANIVKRRIKTDDYLVSFLLKKERKKDRLRNLLVKINTPFREVKCTREGYSRFTFNWFTNDKSFTSEWYNCTSKQFDIINEEVFYWDGSHNERTADRQAIREFSTMHKHNADFIQFSLAARKIQSSICIDNRTQDGRKPSVYYSVKTLTGEGYSLAVNTEATSSLTFTKVNNISDKMFCFTVPSGYFIVRQKDKIFVSGNCGGTTLVLTNDQPYIVAVHLIRMIENKCAQDPNILGVTGKTTSEEIEAYLARTSVPKMMCTYDSVPRLVSQLGIRTQQFCLLVDEVHCLIGYMDRFKPTVAVKLIDGLADTFKSVSYLTATPTNYTYLPAPLKELTQVKFEWADARKPDLVHSFSNRSLTEDVLSTVMGLLETTEDEVFLFYNSRRYVVSLIKKILKLRKDIKLEDINILFSETDENTAYFKKFLGVKFKYGQFPDGVNNKRINLISSMGFEGCDFYPNQVTGANPTTVVVSDPRSKTMRFDIKVQLKQICGRFRANRLTHELPNNKIIYLWAGQEEDVVLDEDKFLRLVKDCNEQSTVGLSANRENFMVMGALKMSAANHHGYWILDENKEVMMHPYAVEAQMSSYHALHSDSFVLNSKIDDSTTITKLSDLSKDINTYTIPMLSSANKTVLGRIPSVQALVKEYTEIFDSARENPQAFQELESFLTNNTQFSEWLDAGVSPQNMNTLNNKGKIDDLASSLRILAKVEEVKLPFVVGRTYKKTKIKEEIQKFYDTSGITLKAKSTDVKKWYEVKATTIGSGDAAFNIIRKI